MFKNILEIILSLFKGKDDSMSDKQIEHYINVSERVKEPETTMVNSPDADPDYISEYVDYDEVVYSQTALKNDLDNDPSPEQLELIRDTAQNIFDPLRIWAGGPVKINSCFRGPELNKMLRASKTSQHCVGLDPSKNSYGSAFDVDDTYKHKTNRQMFFFVKDQIDFDQLIYEYPNEKDNNNAKWLHFSYRGDGKNRKQVLIAVKVNGKTKYLDYHSNKDLIKPIK